MLPAWKRFPYHFTSRMLKKSASGVLATLRGSTYGTKYDLPLRSLRPCLGQGASFGEEAVLADSGREGEVVARVGRVRSLDILSILHWHFLVILGMLVFDSPIPHNGFLGTC